MHTKFSSILSEINSVSIGDSHADLILENCSLINVYTNEIQEKIQISIKNDRIAFVVMMHLTHVAQKPKF